MEEVMKSLQIDQLKIFSQNLVDTCLAEYKESYDLLTEKANQIITEINGGFRIPRPTRKSVKKGVSAVKTGIRMSNRLKKSPGNACNKSLKSPAKEVGRPLRNSSIRKRISSKKAESNLIRPSSVKTRGSTRGTTKIDDSILTRITETSSSSSSVSSNGIRRASKAAKKQICDENQQTTTSKSNENADLHEVIAKPSKAFGGENIKTAETNEGGRIVRKTTRKRATMANIDDDCKKIEKSVAENVCSAKNATVMPTAERKAAVTKCLEAIDAAAKIAMSSTILEVAKTTAETFIMSSATAAAPATGVVKARLKNDANATMVISTNATDAVNTIITKPSMKTGAAASAVTAVKKTDAVSETVTGTIERTMVTTGNVIPNNTVAIDRVDSSDRETNIGARVMLKRKTNQSSCILTPPHNYKYNKLLVVNVAADTDETAKKETAKNYRTKTAPVSELEVNQNNCGDTQQSKKSVHPNPFTPPHLMKYSKNIPNSTCDISLLSLHPLANSTPILKGSNSNKLKQDNDEFKELDNGKINTGQMNVASKGSKSVMNKCDDPVTADKENITPVGKSKIPVFATPNANRPSLLRLQQTKSVKKRIEYLEEQSAGNTKKPTDARKLVVTDASKDQPVRTTRQMTRSKGTAIVNQDTNNKKVLVPARSRPLTAKKTNSSSDGELFNTYKVDLGKLDAQQKKEEKLKATTLELKRKRMERENRAIAAREAAEKEKQQLALKAEKEREERHRQLLKEKEEQMKKKQVAALKAAEADERKKMGKDAQATRSKEIEGERDNCTAEAKSKEYQAVPLALDALVKAGEEERKKMIADKKILKAAPKSQQKPLQKPKINEDIFCENKKDENDSLEEYDIDDMDEYASSEDEDHPKKQVPRWGEQAEIVRQATLQLKEKEPLFYSSKYSRQQDKYPKGEILFPMSKNIRSRQVSALWESRIG